MDRITRAKTRANRVSASRVPLPAGTAHSDLVVFTAEDGTQFFDDSILCNLPET